MHCIFLFCLTAPADTADVFRYHAVPTHPLPAQLVSTQTADPAAGDAPPLYADVAGPEAAQPSAMARQAMPPAYNAVECAGNSENNRIVVDDK